MTDTLCPHCHRSKLPTQQRCSECTYLRDDFAKAAMNALILIVAGANLAELAYAQADDMLRERAKEPEEKK